MADIVTEKVLWKKRNESRALLITRSKFKLKEKVHNKSWRRNVRVRKCFGCTSRRVGDQIIPKTKIKI